MTITINPFLAGIIFTIVAELVIIVGAAAIMTYKDNKKKKQ